MLIPILEKTQCLREDEFSKNEFLGRICICENLFPDFSSSGKYFPERVKTRRVWAGGGYCNIEML